MKHRDSRIEVLTQHLLTQFGVFAFLTLFSSCATSSVKKFDLVRPSRPDLARTGLKDGSLELLPELSSKEVIPGSIVYVKLKVPEHLKDKKLLGDFEGIDVPFFYLTQEGAFAAVLAVPYEHQPGPAILNIRIGDEADESAPQVQTALQILQANYPSEVLKVDGRRVNPQRKRDLIRIKKEQAEVAEIYKRVTPTKFWQGPFQFPIQSRITSPFGSKRIYNGRLKNFHPGLDLKAAIGTPVHSSAPGIVVLAKSLFYTGYTIMIDHGFGVVTLYAHLSALKVKKGDVIQANQLLGLSGKTGRVNGPHLHWQAVVHRVKVNPLGLTQVIQ